MTRVYLTDHTHIDLPGNTVCIPWNDRDHRRLTLDEIRGEPPWSWCALVPSGTVPGRDTSWKPRVRVETPEEEVARLRAEVAALRSEGGPATAVLRAGSPSVLPGARDRGERVLQACNLLGIPHSDFAQCAHDMANLLAERNFWINRDYERRLWWSVLALAAEDSPGDPQAMIVKNRARQALADLYGDELAAVNQEAEVSYLRFLGRPARAGTGEGDVPCPHPPACFKPGPRIPLRYGSAATEVCACGAWRTQHHGPSRWRHDSIEEAAKDKDDA